jgi:SAM-dependent methyltransferase
MTERRVERERHFHDHAFEHGVRAPVSKFYTVAQASDRHYLHLLDMIPDGSAVLEYGCGEVSQALRMAHRCDVTAIDISPVGVEHARDEANRLGLTSAKFAVMDAESLTFSDATFDGVCGSGILHHLDLRRAFGEVARVLKQDGVAIFTEPLGHNPLINAYRDRTPQYRTPDEHPLLMRDLALAQQYFSSVECEYFSLSTLAAVPLRSTRVFTPVLRACEIFDRTLFKVIPPVRRLAWTVVIRCRGVRMRR